MLGFRVHLLFSCDYAYHLLHFQSTRLSSQVVHNGIILKNVHNVISIYDLTKIMTITNDPAAITEFYVCRKFLTRKKMNQNVSPLWSLNNNSTLPIILRYPILKPCEEKRCN